MATFGRAVRHFCHENCVLQQVRCIRCINPRANAHILASFSSHRQNKQLDFRICQTRCMSGKRSFLKDIVDKVKEEFSQSKEMKDNIEKFKQDREKLEQSEAIKKAREKFENIEKERLHTSEAIKKTYEGVREKVSQTAEELAKSELAKKSKEITEEIGKTAGKAGETIMKSGQQIGQTEAFKTVAKGVQVVKEEVDDATSRARSYVPPRELHKRSDYSVLLKDSVQIQPNEDVKDVTMHKDAQWLKNWRDFKDNNQYINKIFDLKMKYDESENSIIRFSRLITDKVGSVFGSAMKKSELSEVLEEITKVDSTFNLADFTHFVENIMIPNILEAMVRANLEVLKDWCHEGPYNVLSVTIKEAISQRYIPSSRILDVGHVDIENGHMMDQGPVLVLSFSAQQIEAWRDFSGKVVAGDADKVHRVTYYWAVCRDQDDLDPRTAWKLIDIKASSQEQMF